MDNAVKALYIATGVLIGVMVLSLAVVLFSNLQNYMNSANEQIKFNDLTRFNTKYMKYINVDLTIQDIVTVAGEAYENNYSYSPDTKVWSEKPNSLYIAIYLNGTRIDTTIKEKMVELLELNIDKKYQCSSDDVMYSENTGRIYKMNFLNKKK